MVMPRAGAAAQQGSAPPPPPPPLPAAAPPPPQAPLLLTFRRPELEGGYRRFHSAAQRGVDTFAALAELVSGCSHAGAASLVGQRR